MPAEKISISLPGSLVSELEELARRDGSTRSCVIQEDSAHYIAARAAQAQDARRRTGVERALAGFDEVATAWGEDSRQGNHYMAELRAGAEDAPDE
jgi:metal-responsive CopG/Arc/MetJ family transcriptional regulator